MTLLFILIYALTLVYLALTERVKRYIVLLGIQGVLLFGIAFFQLQHIDGLHLSFILLETIIVKAIAIPVFLRRIRKRNNLQRLSESNVPTFYSVVIMAGVLVFSFMLSYFLNDEHLQTKFFSVAIASVIGGIYFVITHKSVFTHVIGYLVMENGIFLLSLAVGSEMPMMVSTAVLLDIFMGVLVLGIFINRVGDTFKHTTVDKLSTLRE